MRDPITNVLCELHWLPVIKRLFTVLYINQCIHTGIYPDQLKLSRVKPLHKRGDKTQFGNYRPIALLPSLSKIFERVMFDQLLAYLSNNNLLCINQFGFRPGHSTELAALRLVDHLIAQMDMYNVPTHIYIDLSKAAVPNRGGIPP